MSTDRWRVEPDPPCSADGNPRGFHEFDSYDRASNFTYFLRRYSDVKIFKVVEVAHFKRRVNVDSDSSPVRGE